VPLERDLAALAAALPKTARVVLLGSVATGKYVDVLTSALGRQLHYPPSFIGRGDMSRGGLLLRCASAATELDYAVLDDRAPRHGPRRSNGECWPLAPWLHGFEAEGARHATDRES